MTGSRLGRQEVLVIGAGPAGLAAATTLAGYGRSVTVVDENPRPGGAISRQRFDSSPETRASDMRSLGEHVRFLPNSICHGFDRGEAIVSQLGLVKPVPARSVIVATGARERIRPVPGSLLRGVLACGGAQTLLKGSDSFPHRSVVVAGSGPLLLATASQLLDAGVDVRAVIEEANPATSGLQALWDVAKSMPPAIAGEGGKYLLNLVRHRTKLMFGAKVTRVLGETAVRGVAVTTAKGKRITVVAEGVVFGHGFVSASELVQQAGAATELDATTNSWVPKRDRYFETSVPGLYSVGDCAGVLGQHAAELEGQIAAYGVLRSASQMTPDSNALRKTRRKLRKVQHFQSAMGKLYPRVSFAELDPHAVVCRCERVTQNDISEAVAHGAVGFRTVKLWTRAGMGICQGRTCHPALQDTLEHFGQLQMPTVQFPVRPLPFSTAGDI